MGPARYLIMSHKILVALGALALPFALPSAVLSQPVSRPEMDKAGDEKSSSDKLSVELPDGVTSAMLGKRNPQTIAVQAMLDRSRHSPGVVDGLMGGNTKRAIRYYRMANELPKGEKIDGELLRSLLSTQTGDVFKSYTITQDDVSTDWTDVPADFAAMADLDRVGYNNAQEMLAERFHMDEEFLAAINPKANFGKAGTKLVIISYGDETLNAKIARIEVRKSDNTVAALDGSGKLLASYPATIGSGDFPSPSGSMSVSAIAPEANYTFNPDDQKWGPDKTFIIPPGPNNPIGGTWIDLGKNGYGIHGSPDPQKVSKRASHGCVRLTNWDVTELAKALRAGIPVVFT